MEWTCSKKVPEKILSTQIMHENPLELFYTWMKSLGQRKHH